MTILPELEELETDSALAEQWMAALEHAHRLGKQRAAAMHANKWDDDVALCRAWKLFLNQFDTQIQFLLRDAFKDGWALVSTRLILAPK